MSKGHKDNGKRKSKSRYSLFVRIVAIVCAVLLAGSVVSVVITSISGS